MNANLPQYMTIKDFCQYSGFSKYQFWRFAQKTNLSIKDLGTGMGRDWRGLMVDVRAALRAIEALPEADKEIPINLNPGVSANATNVTPQQNVAVAVMEQETEQMEAGE